MTKTMWVGLLCVVLAAFGCDDGDDSGGLFAGLPSDKRVVELDDAEQEKYCDGFKAWGKGLGDDPQTRKGICLTAATLKVAFTDLFGEEPPDPKAEVEACEAEQEKCLKGPLEAKACPVPQPSCKATLGEIERCLRVQQDMIRLLGAYTCDETLNDDTPPPDFDKAAIESCKDVMDLCLDDDDDSGGGDLDGGLLQDVDAGGTDAGGTDSDTLRAELASSLETIRSSAAEAWREANGCTRAAVSSDVLDAFAQDPTQDITGAGIQGNTEWSPRYLPTSVSDAEANAVAYAKSSSIAKLGCDGISIGIGIDVLFEEPSFTIVFGQCLDCGEVCSPTCSMDGGM